MYGIERFDSYDLVKKACCVITTGEVRFYGCFLFTKGVVPCRHNRKGRLTRVWILGIPVADMACLARHMPVIAEAIGINGFVIGAGGKRGPIRRLRRASRREGLLQSQDLSRISSATWR